MGRCIKELNLNRDEMVISTKVFLCARLDLLSHPLTSWSDAHHDFCDCCIYSGTGRQDPNQKGLSRKHIIEGAKRSLERLGIETADIILCHRPDLATPMEEVVRGMNWLIDTNKCYYWGTSEWSAQQLEEAWGIANRLNLVGPCAEQPQYNCFHRERPEKEYAPIYKSYGMGTTVSGLLATWARLTPHRLTRTKRL